MGVSRCLTLGKSQPRIGTTFPIRNAVRLALKAIRRRQKRSYLKRYQLHTFYCPLPPGCSALNLPLQQRYQLTQEEQE